MRVLRRKGMRRRCPYSADVHFKKTKSSDAAIYLLDLYLNKDQDNDIQIMAFAAATALLLSM